MEKYQWCGMLHDAACPRVKALELNEDGTVRRVEFHPPFIDLGNGKGWLTPGSPMLWESGFVYGGPNSLAGH